MQRASVVAAAWLRLAKLRFDKGVSGHLEVLVAENDNLRRRTARRSAAGEQLRADRRRVPGDGRRRRWWTWPSSRRQAKLVLNGLNELNTAAGTLPWIMTDHITRSQLLLAVARPRTDGGPFVVGGIAWYGSRRRRWVSSGTNLVEPWRLFVFRLRAAAGHGDGGCMRDGLRDGALGDAPFLRTVFTDPAQRRVRLDEGVIARRASSCSGWRSTRCTSSSSSGRSHPVGRGVIIACCSPSCPTCCCSPDHPIASGWFGDKSWRPR